MKRLLCVGLILSILLLCGCADTVTPPTTHAPTETTAAIVPETTAAIPPETTAAILPETTAPQETTAPAHSQLYLPDCSPQQMLEYFEEVVLNMEYTDGTGDVTLVQKWTIPIYYGIYGDPTDEDLQVLTDLFAQLNEIPGFPGIYDADGGYENFTISFLNEDDFVDQFSNVINGESAFGATEFWYYTASNEIYTARIGYVTNIDQEIRKSILIEEIINTLGVSDTVLREDSIVYQYSNENTALSHIDWVILKLLYDPTVHCGMDAAACVSAIEELYY